MLSGSSPQPMISSRAMAEATFENVNLEVSAHQPLPTWMSKVTSPTGPSGGQLRRIWHWCPNALVPCKRDGLHDPHSNQVVASERTLSGRSSNGSRAEIFAARFSRDWEVNLGSPEITPSAHVLNSSSVPPMIALRISGNRQTSSTER